MRAYLSGLEGNCLTSQRKLLAERDISKRDNSDEEKKEKIVEQRKLLHVRIFGHRSPSQQVLHYMHYLKSQ